MSASETARVRNPRGQGERLREEILQAALRLVDRGGSPLTLRAVAREAGIAAPSIYPHFADVGEIASAAVAHCFEELDRSLLAARDPLGDPVDRLEAVCHAYLAYAELHPDRYALMFGGRRQQAGGAVEAGGAVVFGTLLASLAECARALRSASKNPRADAVALWAGLHGLAGLAGRLEGLRWPGLEDAERRLVTRLGLLA